MAAHRSRAAAVGLSLVAAVLAAEFLPRAGALLAILFALAVTACWQAGTPRRPADRLLAAGLFFSLGIGSLAATGILFPDTPGAGLRGLLLGITVIPLVFTTAGFALRFDPPDPEGLRKLRDGTE